jgi:hypothetical protein
MDREPSYVLTLRPLPHDVPAVIRLRRGLKYLLRECSLRCTAIRLEQAGDAPPDAPTAAADAAPDEPAGDPARGVAAGRVPAIVGRHGAAFPNPGGGRGGIGGGKATT